MKIIECNGNNKKTYRLKIKKKDYLAMAKAISKVYEKVPKIHEIYHNHGLSDMRFRWDMLWASDFDTCTLYDYLIDDNIDTALRHITNTK